MAFETEREDLIEGRNAVIEALRAGRSIDKIYLAKGETDRTLGHIASKARAQGVVVVETDRRKLDALSATKAHQGVVAVAAVKDYCTVADILRAAEEKGEPPFVIVCDEISDPQNLGAVLRSAECAGAHGVIIPKRRSAGITGVVEKVSAGAESLRSTAGAEGAGTLGLWQRRRCGTQPLGNGFYRPGLPCDRLGRGRDGSAGCGKLRLSGRHPHARAVGFPECRDRSRCADV